MQFSEVIGQKEVKDQLINMVVHNRLSHALLFLGREGTGALSLALALAQYVLCDRVNGKTNTAPAAAPSLFGEPDIAAPAEKISELFNDACGECPSCLKAAALVHPDIHFSYPVVPKKSGDKPVSTDYIKEWREFLEENPYGNSYEWLQRLDAENKQGNITALECNDIIRKMSLKSFEAGYKILIMWMPELLGKEGNKLLKLIEEPPPNSLFLFVAENDAAILPTILSRTQLVKIPPLARRDIETALQSRKAVPAKKAEQLAAMSNGNYHDALEQLSHADEDWEVLLRDWLNSILKTGPSAQIKWIDEVSKIGREKQKQFLAYFIQLVETALTLRCGPAAEEGNGGTLMDFAHRLNKLCGIEQQEAIVNELDKAIYYIERNANAKMLFHALTIKLYHIISNKSVILMQ